MTDLNRTLHDADPGCLIVDKTPSYSEWPEHLAWIVRHFPEARFVHLVRHPSDVIRSLVRMQLTEQSSQRFPDGASPYHVAEAIWIRHNEHIEQALASAAPDRWLRVRYEDLVADPDAVLAGVCDLLGVDQDPAMPTPVPGTPVPLPSAPATPVSTDARASNRDLRARSSTRSATAASRWERATATDRAPARKGLSPGMNRLDPPVRCTARQ